MAKILVADDRVEIRKLTSYRLKTSGHIVVAVEDGAAALRQLADDVFEAAIIDISMPEIDGLALLEHIRSAARLQGLPVIMLTASALDAHQAQAAEYGADEYLTKPVSSAELFAAVERVLRPGRSNENAG